MKKVLTILSLITAFSLSFSLRAHATADTVWVKDNLFMPNSLSLCLGDTIRFVYDAGAANTHNVHITYPVNVVSPDMTTPGDKFEFIPASVDTFTYQCDYHVGMGMTGIFYVNAPPMVSIGDVVQCGGSVTLDAGNMGATYVWSTGATTQTLVVNASGSFWVVAYNSCGNSTASVTVTINPNPPVVNLGPDVTTCGAVTLDAGGAGKGYKYAWSTTEVTQKITVLSSGMYSVKVTDTMSCVTFDTINVTINGLNPLMEGFNDPANFPFGWNTSNPDNDISWAITNTIKNPHLGAGAIYMNNFSDTTIGSKDYLITPMLCNAPMLTFWRAYQLYTDPSSPNAKSDTLVIEWSADTGATWTQVYKKYGASGSNKLVTAAKAFSTVPFEPFGNEWMEDTVMLPTNKPQLMVRFVNISNYENNLYIDDVDIAGGTGVEEIIQEDMVSVYPNPTTDNIFVHINAYDLGNVTLKLYNIMGETISQTKETVSVPAKFTFNLSNYPAGIYLLEVRSENNKSVKKIILNK
ncbi:MAG: T9SS type A sorting domain-containing protein [Bacteroidetes bacterium]|nr:T9SS type A sorting domain-containing protein [Bacteroidota bacterium]